MSRGRADLVEPIEEHGRDAKCLAMMILYFGVSFESLIYRLHNRRECLQRADSPRKSLASRRRRCEAAPATAGHLPRSAARSEACRQCATRYGSSNATVGPMREHEAATATFDTPTNLARSRSRAN